MNFMRFRFTILLVSFAVLTFSVAVPAQLDPNPNSAPPVLLHGKQSSRALAAESLKTPGKLPVEKKSAFDPNSDIYLFLNVVDLPESEKANAFHVYAKDKKNRMYRFPVKSIDRISKQEPLYAMRITLKDEIGFWSQPSATGDLVIQVTWRGLGSNQLLLGLGRTGGLKFEAKTPQKKIKSDAASENYVGYRWNGDRKRFLEQATFGSTPALDQRLRRIGLRVWLAEQLAAPYPSTANPYPEFPLKSGNVQTGCPFPTNSPEYTQCRRDHYTQIPLMNWFFKEAFYGEPQLRHRTAWALSQLWVTSGQTIQQSSHMIAYHKVLSQHAFGNFRDLMKDMTLNPAMGDYLDMARSTRNNPNENFAREILQLFTVGLVMLNPDGTPQLDGGVPIPTYDQEKVNNFTKVFTGFRFCNVGCPNSTIGAVNFKDPLILQQNLHDTDAKTLLSYPNAINENIPSGLDGNAELDLALDNIFNHPNVGPFVSKFLIQHLVTSDPTPAYVGRVSAAFNNNGHGVRGDMKEVIRTILLDAEARGDVKTDPNFGKLREPVLHVTNFYRNFNVRSADGTEQSDGVVWQLPQSMSQLPFYPNTVFNYYTPNYIVPGTSLLAPEFGILNTGSAIQRTNVATIMSFLPVEVDTRNPPLITKGTSINVDDLIQLSANDATGGLLLDELDRKLMHSMMSSGMRQKVLDAVLVVPSSENDFRVRTALFLIASSSQFQIQR
jgi:hypothetical protein